MKHGSFFEKNLGIIRRSNPELAKTISELAPKVEGRLYPLKAVNEHYNNVQIFTTSQTSQSLFATSNPESEIKSWLERSPFNAEKDHAVILLGFGLGYYALHILDILPKNGVLVIVDPDPLIFFTAFAHVDLSRLVGDERVQLYIGQGLEKAINSIGEELKWSRFLSLSYHVLVNPLLRRCRPDYPTQFTEYWRNCLQRELMYRNSRIEHGNKVVIHTVSNADGLVNYPGVNSLFHHFQHIPAALAAAGPSLENELTTLRDAQDQMLIACVNTAYPILRKNGIRPHIVFTMDHQDRNLRSFKDDQPSNETYLIADPRIHPDIIRHFHPRVFLASWRTTSEILGKPAPLGQVPVPQKSGNSFYLWLQSTIDYKGDVYGPGSVAVVAFHILARLGCRPIVLVGQDLAFTEDKRYASGTIFDDKEMPQDSNAAHWVNSVDGGKVPTSETLYLYRQWLEHEIARFGIPVFNTSSGAVISGSITTRLLSLLMEIKPGLRDIAQQLSMLHQSYRAKKDIIDLRRILYEAYTKIERFGEVAREGLNLSSPDEFASLNRGEKQNLLQKLEQTINQCSEDHAEALELLNELLQEAHFDYEDSRWQTLQLENEDEILDEKLRSRFRVLDSFVRQCGIMCSLLEDKIKALRP